MPEKLERLPKPFGARSSTCVRRRATPRVESVTRAVTGVLRVLKTSEALVHRKYISARQGRACSLVLGNQDAAHGLHRHQEESSANDLGFIGHDWDSQWISISGLQQESAPCLGHCRRQWPLRSFCDLGFLGHGSREGSRTR